MLLSTEHSHLRDAFGDEGAIERLAAAGFDAVDMSLFCMSFDDNVFNTAAYRRRAEELRAFANRLGIGFNQSHACFGFDWTDSAAFTEIFWPKQTRAIEIAGILGCKSIVIHPLHGPVCYVGNEEMLFEVNMKFYRALLPYARAAGVKIALENMWQTDTKRGVIDDSVCSRAAELARYIDALDDPQFIACLDLGHCGLVGEAPADAIRILGHDRLHALHVHDNDFRGDMHTIPYQGKIDWEGVMQALAEIDYDGDLTMEASYFSERMPPELKAASDRYMVAVGRHLISRFAYYQQNK